MLVFMKCIAEAVMENGVKGLAALVPGGEAAYKVAEGAYKKYRERKKEADQRKEVEALAQANFENAKQQAIQAVREALAEVAQINPERAVASESDQSQLVDYLTQLPGAVRQTLVRKEDPTGRTAPAAFAITSAADVANMMPRMPRFKPGDGLAGRPGWVLERPLGVGGFGEVWLARHERLTSLVRAVKFCLGQQARDIRHESGVIDRVMQAGQHSHIVPLLDVSLDGDTPWLMYEYVQGGDLADVIRMLQSLSPEMRYKQAFGALRQIASAVAHFHKLMPPVVHRDLKPNNILLDKVNKKLRITDFGIGAVAAKTALDEEARAGSPGGGRMATYLLGSHTPTYASPQQRSGLAPDPRDDVHALGVIAFQLLTGDLTAVPGRDMDEDLREAGVPDALVALIARSVAQKAERRPNDAREWGAALVAVAESEKSAGGSERTEVKKLEKPYRLNANGLAILKALKKRGATHPTKAVSKYLLMAEDGCGPHLYDMGSEEGEQGLIDWVEQPKSPVPELTRSKWTLWITAAGLNAIDNHILREDKQRKAAAVPGEDDEEGGEDDGDGFWFVNVGEGGYRNWDDCRKYGFLAAGGGSRYSDALDRLPIGAKVFGYMKGRGYVGYGEVTQTAVRARDFVPQGAATTLLELPDIYEGMRHDSDDEEMAEWVVGVRWHKTFSRDEAKRFTGAFANQNIVCRLTDEETIDFLRTEFDVPA